MTQLATILLQHLQQNCAVHDLEHAEGRENHRIKRLNQQKSATTGGSRGHIHAQLPSTTPTNTASPTQWLFLNAAKHAAGARSRINHC